MIYLTQISGVNYLSYHARILDGIEQAENFAQDI